MYRHLTTHTTIKSAQSVYKQALKALDNKPKSYHHCDILPRCGVLCWENLNKFHNSCLIIKILNGLAFPTFTRFIFQNNAGDRLTRSSVRGDIVVPRRKTSFGQTAFTVRASQFWNSLPLNIRQSDSCRPYYYIILKLG